jgi:hypothetical protein
MSHLDPNQKPAARPSLMWIVMTVGICLVVAVGGIAIVGLIFLYQSRDAPSKASAPIQSSFPLATPVSSGLAAAAPATARPSLPAEVTDPNIRQDAIQRLLRDRADALLLGDQAAWIGQQVPLAAVPDFPSIALLAPVAFEYSVTSITSSNDPTQATVTALVRYRLPMDVAVATFREDLALQHSDTGWRIAAEHAVGRKPVWELGKISVVTGQRTTVIGIDQSHAILQRYLEIGDAVIPNVTKAWGTDWTRRLVIIVPKNLHQMEDGLSRSAASLTDIAAVTSMETASGDPGSPRIWLNTPTMQGLSSLGREIVLRHEVVHVATGSGSTDATPLWLEDGLAEYIGYQDSGVSRGVAAADAIDALRDGQKFDHLPTSDDFAGPNLNVAYESALIACDELADEGGISQLVKTYRLTAQGTGSSDENLAAAIHQVYGITLDEFIHDWVARLHQLAGLPFTPEPDLGQPSTPPEQSPSPRTSVNAEPSVSPRPSATAQPSVPTRPSGSAQPTASTSP